MNNQQKLFQVLADVFNVDVRYLDEASSPDSVPGWDSLAIVTLVVELEAAFGVQFDILEIANFNNVNIIISALKEKGVEI